MIYYITICQVDIDIITLSFPLYTLCMFAG
uniref:Uncharacterized protein n=1 Tax=Arundo donax TaxID=35708 RepID=A0A0A9ET19_ARUDO